MKSAIYSCDFDSPCQRIPYLRTTKLARAILIPPKGTFDQYSYQKKIDNLENYFSEVIWISTVSNAIF